MPMGKGLRRAVCALCLLALGFSVLPLYGMTGYNHPYYDDFGFSAAPHQVWKETGDLGAALKAALENAAQTRYTWQGTYTGTLLSNLQPGTFSEELYWISGCFLLTAFLGCFWFFFATVFGRRGLGLMRWETTVLSSLTLTVMLQFMPDMGEAFYWFNGGVGNVFIYSLMALSAALLVRLYRTESRGGAAGLTAVLLLCMAALGGGSYSGGLFSLCALACVLAWLFGKRRPRRWRFLLCFAVLAAGFVYSMSAPGNTVRAGMIGYTCSPVKAVARSLYEGVILMTGYVRFPLLGLTALVSPLLWRAALHLPSSVLADLPDGGSVLRPADPADLLHRLHRGRAHSGYVLAVLRGAVASLGLCTVGLRRPEMAGSPAGAVGPGRRRAGPLPVAGGLSGLPVPGRYALRRAEHDGQQRLDESCKRRSGAVRPGNDGTGAASE